MCTALRIKFNLVTKYGQPDILNEEYIDTSLSARSTIYDIFSEPMWPIKEIEDFYNMYDGCFFE